MARKQQTPPPTPAPAPAPAEGYTVLARRYRPQTFTELVGQEPVSRALTNALKGNRVAHAYLFTGARGVGKTSTARILAKALNCVNGPTPEPCGVCEVCQSITSGDDVDVLEIDGASNNGVDDVRDLRANVQYRPQRARFKIYIIDEVHMLTKGAFNALLKTLEEPPPHVKFIFATTEVEKVPITILSRCQRFDFPGITLPRLVERLEQVVSGEGVKADREALELVARRAGGSMRDAQSLLDQLLAFGGDRLTADQVHRLLGTAGDERIVALAEALVGRDARKALDLLDEAVVGGLQLGELVDQLMHYWRDLMVVHCGGTEGRDLSIPPRHHDTLRKQAGGLTLDAILAGLDVLAQTRERLRGSNHGRTLIEMALVRLTRLTDLVSVAQLARSLEGLRGSMPAGGQPAAPARGAPVSGDGGVKKNSLTATEPPMGEEVVTLTEDTLARVWAHVRTSVGGMLGTELGKAGNPAISGPNTLVLRFPTGYNKAREFCQAPERLRRVEDALRRATGQTWMVRLEGGSAGNSGVGTEGAERAGGKPPPDTPAQPKRNTREEAEKLPLVRRALDVFGATLKQVDEGFAESPREPE